MSNAIELAKRGSRWLGFAGSVLTTVIGVIHIMDSGAYLKWPVANAPFVKDFAKETWRDRLFSLRPDIFVESWTPILTGVAGVLTHVQQFPRFKVLSSSFFNYFWFLMFEGLFATVCYCGGLGMVFSIPVFLAALLACIGLLFNESDASLSLDWHVPNVTEDRAREIYIVDN